MKDIEINRSEYFILFIFCCFLKIFIVIQLQLYAFSPHPSTPPQLNPPPSATSTHPPAPDFVHVWETISKYPGFTECQAFYAPLLRLLFYR